jgi:hypothetical protein
MGSAHLHPAKGPPPTEEIHRVAVKLLADFRVIWKIESPTVCAKICRTSEAGVRVMLLGTVTLELLQP